MGPLSQPGDVLCGDSVKWGIEQAVADLNAKGGVLGRKVRLVYHDTQNKPDVAAAVSKRLTEEDKVVAVVGECHSGAALAQIPAYEKAGIPVVFSETYNDTITAGDPSDPNLPANPPTIFRLAPTNTYYNGFIAMSMSATLGRTGCLGLLKSSAISNARSGQRPVACAMENGGWVRATFARAPDAGVRPRARKDTGVLPLPKTHRTPISTVPAI